MIEIQRHRVGSIDFTVVPFKDAVELLLSAVADVPSRGHPGVAVHFANAYNVALARREPSYARLLQSGDYVFSDGVPITWAGKRAYPTAASAWDRVYGPDAMNALFAASTPSTHRHVKHYLLGSTPEVLKALTRNLQQRYPHAEIVGSASPSFGAPTSQELDERDAQIAGSGATMVWVGLGTPKQDVEVARLAASLPVVALAVGAAFDFLAGTTTQAPLWMQKNGLEWAYRLGSEPRRLGKRYLWGNSVFMFEAARTLRNSAHRG